MIPISEDINTEEELGTMNLEAPVYECYSHGAAFGVRLPSGEQTAALFAEFLCLVPLTYAFVLFGDRSRALAQAFGLSFAAAIFVFTVAMQVLEWREQRGLAHD